MPRISAFYGIVVAMFYNDHPPPHIHVVYGGPGAGRFTSATRGGDGPGVGRLA